MNVYDFILSSCFPDARLDLSAEDNVIALALAGYPARPYAELIRSNIPGPSNPRSARSSTSRSSPAATLGSSHWAYCCHSYQGRDFGSFGGDVSEAPECEKEKTKLH